MTSTLAQRAATVGVKADLLASLATRYYSSTAAQDRKRQLWASMSARDQRHTHLMAEWRCAQEEHELAIAEDRPVDAARYLDVMERLNIQLNDLEGVR